MSDKGERTIASFRYLIRQYNEAIWAARQWYATYCDGLYEMASEHPEIKCRWDAVREIDAEINQLLHVTGRTGRHDGETVMDVDKEPA